MPAHSEQIQRYTPEYIFAGLNVRFNLDPCSPPVYAPCWDYCKLSYRLDRDEDGLALPWELEDGTPLFVFLNPPWTRGAKSKWLAKLRAHGNGIALVRGNTDGAWLHDNLPDALFLLRKRVAYIRGDDQPERPRKGGAVGGFEPSMILAMGGAAMDVLAECKLEGAYYQFSPPNPNPRTESRERP